MEAAESLHDYLKQQDALDKEARELFPYDFSACSFEEGYVKQQVFACLTCEPAQSSETVAAPQRGGVCYACSIACHGDHELVELFNKRHFRCDCGSDRISSGAHCSLMKARRPINAENRYNQNYSGLFCWCRVPYDPEKEVRTMYQCLQCEDWYHDECIKKSEVLPDEASFDQFICRSCTADMAWLKRYAGRIGFDASAPAQEKANCEDTAKRSTDLQDTSDDRPTKRFKVDEEVKTETAGTQFTASASNKVEEAPTIAKSDASCIWQTLPDQTQIDSLFLREVFRSALCTCEACTTRMAPYPFLLEEEDVYDPPEDNDDDGESVYEAGTRVMAETLDRLPREQAIEGVMQYTKLKEHLTRCLRPLAEQGEIVTADHVRAFFEQRKSGTD